MASAIYDMSPEHKDNIHECGIPTTLFNGLVITSIISTFIKLSIITLLVVNLPSLLTIALGSLFVISVVAQRITFPQEMEYFMRGRGKQSKLVLVEAVMAILFYGSIFTAILSEIF